MTDPLRIGFLGRIPPALGGAGLELQMERTGAALERRGHTVTHMEAAEAGTEVDVLHAFGSEPGVWHQLRHRTRNRVPLVVTSVVVVSPGIQERALRLAARLPGVLTSTRMRAEVLREAAAVIAGSEYERRLVRQLGAPADRVEVVGNGADRTRPGDLPPGLAEPYALMVGTVSQRKRQADVVRALAGRLQVVVTGGYGGPPEGLAAWQRAVEETGARWLDHVEDPATVAALQRNAVATVHLSQAEVQSLAVIEALGQGSPVVLSDIPSHRELEAAHPSFVRVVGGPAELPAALDSLRERPPQGRPDVPGWGDVAERLERIYARVLHGGRS